MDAMTTPEARMTGDRTNSVTPTSTTTTSTSTEPEMNQAAYFTEIRWYPPIKTGTVIHGTLRHEDLIPAFHAELVRVAPKDVKIDPPSLEWGGIEVERLMDELNRYAPDGWYFGSHPGDGSDFGWWEYE